ncbi:MAG: hypothetical protein FJ290_32350 [Planctomycetes bacterium]|nr:hypothetical protein [Planctomycetota bacterium]
MEPASPPRADYSCRAAASQCKASLDPHLLVLVVVLVVVVEPAGSPPSAFDDEDDDDNADD